MRRQGLPVGDYRRFLFRNKAEIIFVNDGQYRFKLYVSLANIKGESIPAQIHILDLPQKRGARQESSPKRESFAMETLDKRDIVGFPGRRFVQLRSEGTRLFLSTNLPTPRYNSYSVSRVSRIGARISRFHQSALFRSDFVATFVSFVFTHSNIRQSMWC